MPVPASYNDITTNSSIRDYVGWVWYDTVFYVHPGWEDARVLVRFGSVNYNAIVYVNGELVIHHSGGHLPFEAEVSDVDIGMKLEVASKPLEDDEIVAAFAAVVPDSELDVKAFE